MMKNQDHSQGCYTEFMLAIAIGCNIIFESEFNKVIAKDNTYNKKIFK